jgi:hypothetical protein
VRAWRLSSRFVGGLKAALECEKLKVNQGDPMLNRISPSDRIQAHPS